jgi:GTPase SAR1 family protein
MNYIKKFESFEITDDGGPMDRPIPTKKDGQSSIAKAMFFTNKLHAGFAIEVMNKDVAEFVNILKNWFTVPKKLEEFINDKYYFILVGNRLLHTNTPNIGGTTLEMFKFEDY